MAFRALRWAVVLLVGMGAVPAAAQTGPRSCSVSSQNLYVRDVMFDLYLWRQQLPSVNAAAFSSPEAYLEAVRDPRWTAHSVSSPPPRRTTRSIATVSSSATASATTTDGITELRVLQVYKDSPASEAGLVRGDRIFTVERTKRVESMVAAGSVGGAFGDAEIGVPRRTIRVGRRGRSAPPGPHDEASRDHSDGFADQRCRG